MKETGYSYLKIAFWSFIFALGCNLFIVPYGLYNGGIIGTAQLLRTLIRNIYPQELNFDPAGLINFLLNLPLLYLAFTKLSRSFACKTIFSVVIQTIAFSISFPEPLLQDRALSILIGAFVTGTALSRILTEKGSAGGNDIVGMILSCKCPGFTVGRYSLYYNAVLYLCCGILFNVETAVYSIAQSAVFSYVTDRGHLENLDVSLMIFTHKAELKDILLKDNHRGVTCWKALGAFTGRETEVLVSVVSRYEAEMIRRRCQELDPEAFIITSKVLQVNGSYERRLI